MPRPVAEVRAIRFESLVDTDGLTARCEVHDLSIGNVCLSDCWITVLERDRVRPVVATLGELRAGMHKYPQELINVPLGRAHAADIMRCKPVTDAVHAVEAAMGDDGRVLLRPSGTEPLIRVMVEGREADAVVARAVAIADAVRSQLGA